VATAVTGGLGILGNGLSLLVLGRRSRLGFTGFNID
jgi:hypothetical protein